MLQNSALAAQSRIPLASPAQALDLHGVQVLLVEDDAIVALDIADTLSAFGCGLCAVARSEGEAVRAAEADRPDLVIADVALRDGCGIAAVERIIRTRAVPYLFMTGDVTSVQERAPAAIVISKPFDVRTLLSAVRRALQRGVTPAEGGCMQALPAQQWSRRA